MTHAQRNRRRRRGTRRSAQQGLPRPHGAGDPRRARAGSAASATSSRRRLGAAARRRSSRKPTGDNTRVFAADGKPLGFIQADELHLPLRADEIPQVVKDATIAIEDERFYKHKGVDYEGVVRAAIKNVTVAQDRAGRLDDHDAARPHALHLQRAHLHAQDPRGEARRGARGRALARSGSSRSTSTRSRTARSAASRAIGIKAAAKIYFSKHLKDLTLREAALLAGLPQAPSDYSPTRSKAAAKARRNEVLRKMAELRHGHAERRREQAIGRSLGIKRLAVLHAPARGVLLRLRQGPAVPRVRRADRPRGRDEGLHDDRPATSRRRRATRSPTTSPASGPSSAIVTLNPRNGYIEAMASSGDYGESNFNLAAQGHRQPGSTFKVMALMTALRRGVDPDVDALRLEVADATSTTRIYGKFDIKTYGGVGAGNLSLRQATLKSDNSVYIQLAMDLGPDEVKQTGARHGHHARRSRATRPRRSAAWRTASRRSRWRPRTRASPRAATACGRRRSRRSCSPTGASRRATTLPQALPRQEGRASSRTASPPRRREILEQNIQGGTGTHAHDRLPGGRQDRHDRQQHRRLVRRLHAAPARPPSGSATPTGRHPDERPLLRPQRRRRHVPGRHLGRLHGPHQGQLLRRLRAAASSRSSSSPFFGKYAKSGGSLTGGERREPDADRRRPTTGRRHRRTTDEPESTGDDRRRDDGDARASTRRSTSRAAAASRRPAPPTRRRPRAAARSAPPG